MPFTKNMQIRSFYDNKGWKSPGGNSILLLNGYIHKKSNMLSHAQILRYHNELYIHRFEWLHLLYLVAVLNLN